MRYVGNKLITEGKIEKDGELIKYEIAWVSDGEEYQIDEIWDSDVISLNGKQLDYDEDSQKYDDLIIEDAYKHQPKIEDDQPMTYEQFCEKRAEEQYEAMQIEKHFA